MADLKDIQGLKGRISATRRGLVRLAVARAYWPLLLFLVFSAVFVLAGAYDRLPASTAAAATLGAIILSVLLFLQGRRAYRKTSATEAVAAMDAQSDMRPISALADRPAPLPGSENALWGAHDQKLRQAAARLRPAHFSGEWKALDPAFLRVFAPIVLIAGLVYAGPDAPGRLTRALNPDIGALLGAGDMRIEAWVTPPAYSRRAPIFINADMDTVRAPAGSQLTVRASAKSAPKLRLDTGRNKTSPMQPTPDGAFESTATIETDTRVSVRWWGERRAIQINVLPDAPPSAVFVETPIRTGQDKTEFKWAASDDYGVEKLEVAVKLIEPHPAAPDAEHREPIPFPGVAPKEAEETATLDLTRHRWAGMEVEARIVATDGAGQEGFSQPHVFVLPEKLFLQPLAKAAQENRVTVLRDPRAYADIPANADATQAGAVNTAPSSRLEYAPEDVQRASVMLDALTYRPETYFRDYSIYFGLRMAQEILETATSKDEADSIDPVLWAVALKAEYGSAADALRALLAARRALEQALRDGASEDEIRRLMQAFREAAENYLAARMAEALAQGLDAPPPDTDGEMAGGGPGLGGQDFEDMLNALEDLTETGAADQARQLLSDITNMLENLQFQQGGSGQGGFPGMPGQPGEGDEGEQSAEERELSDTMERLTDLLREQRELNDDTLAEGRGERQPGESGAPGEEGGDGEGQSLADRQEGLGDALSEFAERFGGQIGGGDEEGEDGAGRGSAEDRLGEIEDAQRRAADSLRRGNLGMAERQQERATRMLRDLNAELAEQLDELQEANGQDGSPTDPFGRMTGGINDDDSVEIPEEAERQRAKDILEELRRRFEDAEDSEERDYLERLLDRF